MTHSTYHQLMKFQTPHGIRVVRSDQHVARNCYVHSVCHHILKKKTLSIQTKENPRDERSFPQPIEGLKRIKVDGPENVV